MNKVIDLYDYKKLKLCEGMNEHQGDAYMYMLQGKETKKTFLKYRWLNGEYN